jgi:hypothetical protein
VNAPRPLSTIAREIRDDIMASGQTNRTAYARPYLVAMLALDNINQPYGADSGSSVVAYFLANAQQWRGATARRIKAELNAMLKEVRRHD